MPARYGNGSGQEILNLSWVHVDFTRAEVSVAQVNLYDEESDSTKTSVSRRVKLNSMALAALVRQKQITSEAGGMVFLDPNTGQAWKYDKVTDARSYWAAALKAKGIRYLRAAQVPALTGLRILKGSSIMRSKLYVLYKTLSRRKEICPSHATMETG